MLSGPVKEVTSVAVGDAGVQVNVDNRVPQVGGQVVFGVRSVIRRQVVPGVRSSGARSDNGTSDQVGVKVAIDVSEGLQFVPGLQPPGGTTFSSDTMIWDVGTVDSDLTTWLTLDVPVVVTPSPSLAELPLERRCLTAEVVEALPAYETDPRWELNDVFTLCLGQRPAVISDGEIALWWLHNCVGENRYPCGVAESIELFARVNCAEHVSQGIEQYCRGGIGDYEEYIDPRSVIVQIQDPGGRAKDAHPDSVVTDSGVVSWQTANVGDTGTPRAAHKHRNGVSLIESQEDLKNEASDWYSFGPFTVTKRESVPGHFKIRNSFDGSIWYDPMPTATQESFTDSSYLDSYEEFIEFERLGTYVMTYKAEATGKDRRTHSAEGTYTFHVGPISELEVRGGRQDQVAPQGQQAYTILATNNGPDMAPDVEVTLSGVPEGSQPRLSDGAYRELACQDGLCDAIWDLGELPVTGGRIAKGLTEFPTLTLIAPAGSGAPNISASIANTQDYSVVIDGTTHSTNYLDYYAPNDTAVIVARVGAGDPSQPSVTTAQAYPQPPTAVLRWDPVERVNLWPVSHYELSRSDASCGLPDSNDTPERVDGTLFVDDLGPNGLDEPFCYYVRAVSDLGVPGTWSAPARVPPTTPRLVQMGFDTRSIAEFGDQVRVYVEVADGLSPSGDERTIDFTLGGTATFGEDYTIEGCASKPDPCSVTLPANAYSAAFTIKIISDGLVEEDETIILKLIDGNGYTVQEEKKTATITIGDDDSPGLQFHRRWADVDEGGSEEYTVRLKSQPTAAVTVTIVSDNEDVTVSPASLTFNPLGDDRRWNQEQMVTVKAAHDSDSVDDIATLTHTTAGGGYGGANALSIDRPVSVADDEPRGVGPRPGLPIVNITAVEAITEGSPITFTVTADSAQASDLTVNVLVSEFTGNLQDFVAAEDESVRTVTIKAGKTSATFTVDIADDMIAEDPGLVHAYVNYGTGYTPGDGAVVIVHDNGNGNPGGNPETQAEDSLAAASFASASSSAAEDAGTQHVVVNLSEAAPSGGLIVGYSISGSATAGSSADYTVPNIVTVIAGERSATIPVTVNDDSANEGDETIILTIAGGTGYTLGSTTVHTLTITDNDAPPATCKLPADAITVAEVTDWRDALDPIKAAAGIKRWNRVLATLGVDTGLEPMSTELAWDVANWLKNTRWDRTARTLEAMSQCDN